MLVEVLPHSQFNFDFLVRTSEEVIVADNVPVSDAINVALSVRVHGIAVSSGGSFQFLIYGVNPSDTDGSVFITPAAIGSTGLITGISPNLVGLSSLITEPVHPFVRIVLHVEGPPAAGSVYADLSADLVCRGPL